MTFIWGKPVAVSNNGLIYIFKLRQARFVYILKLNPLERYGFTQVKMIDIRKAILDQIKFEANSDDPSDQDVVKEKYGLNKGGLFQNLLEQIVYRNVIHF